MVVEEDSKKFKTSSLGGYISMGRTVKRGVRAYAMRGSRWEGDRGPDAPPGKLQKYRVFQQF